MLIESNIKAYYDLNTAFFLSKGYYIKTAASLVKSGKKAPLSLHDYIPKKSYLNFTYEKETKCLFDNKNRNRSNPPAQKFCIITLQNKENCQKNYKQLLVDNILYQRKRSAIQISLFTKRKLLQLKAKRRLLIHRILKGREKLIIRIQSVFRGYVIRKDWRNISLCDLVFFYDINDNMIHKLTMNNNQNNNTFNNNCKGNGYDKKGLINIKLCIYKNGKKGKQIQFYYSRGLKSYYLPLLKRGVIKNRYKVNFIVNDQTIIDPRYDVSNDDKGNFYNIISKAMIIDFKKKEMRVSEPPTKKYWESIFKMKSKRYKHSNSCDSLSVSNNTELSNEPFVSSTVPVNKDDTIIPKNIKPILKNPFLKSESFSLRARASTNHVVRFNTTVQYSY